MPKDLLDHSAVLASLPGIAAAFEGYKGADPFDHCVIDNFFAPQIAGVLADEFPDFKSPVWHEYNNTIEIKKTLNVWNNFPVMTYSVISALNSIAFTALVSRLSGIDPLYADQGLNGGGWHIHGPGGRLNPHLDYSIHPKLGLQRKLNLIVYLGRDWRDGWGAQLGLWRVRPGAYGPGELAREIEPRFNRAVVFDTTMNSWHGLTSAVACPEGHYRKSIALYYLTDPPEGTDCRGKALFHPTKDQEKDQAVLDLIKVRSSVSGASTTYRK